MQAIQRFGILRALSFAAACAASAACTTTTRASFQTPEEALHAVAEVVGTDDPKRVDEIFGKNGIELLQSGDAVADHQDALRVQAAIREKLAFEERGRDCKIALIGADAWPFPIPLVLESGRWRFDVEAGREELTNRRIGRNELITLATLHEFVSAQREYFSQSHDGEVRAYARKIVSSPGRQDGLYWPAADGEPESPLGPLIADAASDGYTPGQGSPRPFHGYYFRALTSQGKTVPGGERSYLDAKGRMTRGFAVLAWPAKYGNSGVMTFQVDEQGIVYQKDLGAETDAEAARITAYCPDDSWDPTGD